MSNFSGCRLNKSTDCTVHFVDVSICNSSCVLCVTSSTASSKEKEVVIAADFTFISLS